MEDKIDEKSCISVTGHLLIRDAKTKRVIVNKRDIQPPVTRHGEQNDRDD